MLPPVDAYLGQGILVHTHSCHHIECLLSPGHSKPAGHYHKLVDGLQSVLQNQAVQDWWLPCLRALQEQQQATMHL